MVPSFQFCHVRCAEMNATHECTVASRMPSISCRMPVVNCKRSAGMNRQGPQMVARPELRLRAYRQGRLLRRSAAREASSSLRRCRGSLGPSCPRGTYSPYLRREGGRAGGTPGWVCYWEGSMMTSEPGCAAGVAALQQRRQAAATPRHCPALQTSRLHAPCALTCEASSGRSACG